MRDIIYNILICCLMRLPLKGLHFIGNLLGGIIWYFARSRRKYAINAVKDRLKVSRSQAKKIARSSFFNSGCSFLEIIYQNDDHRFLNNRVEITDPVKLRYMQSLSRPIVFTCAHFGGWELLSDIVKMLLDKKEGMAVVRLPKDESLARVMMHLRCKSRIKVIPHRNSAAKILRHLKSGGIVGFLTDHNCNRNEALFLPFLGKSAAVNSGPALLAVRSGAVVCPLFLMRLPGGKYRLLFEQPLDTLELKGSRQEKIEECARFYTRATEKIVREHPEQWFWMHKRWKTRPPEENE